MSHICETEVSDVRDASGLQSTIMFLQIVQRVIESKLLAQYRFFFFVKLICCSLQTWLESNAVSKLKLSSVYGLVIKVDQISCWNILSRQRLE